ncbi:hypothetical protein [Thalassospira mesophila]|nr:hypothetical protein [Thalassospira mesophila]
MASGNSAAEDGGRTSARAHDADGQDADEGPSVRHSSADAASQSSSTLSRYDREDLAALAELPFVIRAVSVVGTLALIVGIILLSLFIVNWLNAP